MESVKHEDVALLLQSSPTRDEACFQNEATAPVYGFSNDYMKAVLTAPPSARLSRYSAPLISYALALLQLHIIAAHAVAFRLLRIDKLWYVWTSLVASASVFAAIEARPRWDAETRKKWHQRWFWTACDGWLRCVKLTAYILFAMLQADQILQISAIVFLSSTVVISALVCWAIGHKLKMMPNLFLDFYVHNPLSFHVAYFSIFAIGGSTFWHVEARQPRLHYPLSIGLDSAALAGMTIIPRGLTIILLDIPLLVLAFVAPMKPLFYDEDSIAAWTARAMLPLAVLSWIKFRCDLRLFIEGPNYKERRTVAKKRREYSGRWIKTHKARRQLTHELVREEEERLQQQDERDSRNLACEPQESTLQHNVDEDPVERDDLHTTVGHDDSASAAPHAAPYTLPGQNGMSPLVVDRMPSPQARSLQGAAESAQARVLGKCVDNNADEYDSKHSLEALDVRQWPSDVEDEYVEAPAVAARNGYGLAHDTALNDATRVHTFRVEAARRCNTSDRGKILSMRRVHVEHTNTALCESVSKLDFHVADVDVGTNITLCEGARKIDSRAVGVDVGANNALRKKVSKLDPDGLDVDVDTNNNAPCEGIENNDSTHVIDVDVDNLLAQEGLNKPSCI